MRRSTLAVLVAALALGACVAVPGGQQPSPYNTYAGNSRFVTPYVYRRGGDNYLYDQSRRSWQPNAYRQRPPYGQTRYAGPDRQDGPPRNRGYGRDNGRDRDRD